MNPWAPCRCRQRSLTQTTRFDRVFLPDDPELWPPATEAALEKQLASLQESIASGKEGKEELVKEVEKLTEEKKELWQNPVCLWVYFFHSFRAVRTSSHSTLTS